MRLRTPAQFVVACVLLTLCVPTLAAADAPRDFLFRATTGPSYAWLFDNYLQGPAVDVSLAAGKFVDRTLAIQLTLAGSATISTSVDGASSNHDAQFYGGGVGVTYYSFSNEYGSLSLLGGSQRLDSRTRLNVLASELLVGKEWGEGKTGYGIALGIFVSMSSESSYDRQFSGSASLRFSLTMK